MGQRKIDELKSQMVPVLVKHRVRRAGLFGSVVRDDFTDGSDVDVLVEPDPEASMLDIVAIRLDLEMELGREVDVVQYKTIHPRLRQYILPEEIRIYDQNA